MNPELTVAGAQERIEDFMRAGGQAPEHSGPHVPRAEIVLRRLHMLREEVQELEDAYREGDIVEVADAYADILVIALGGAVDSRIDIAEILAEVLRSNDTKIDWENEEPWAVRSDGKVGKDWHFDPPNVAALVNGQIRASM